MGKYDDRTAAITFTVTTEYSFEDEWADVAKAMGVTPAKLEKIIEDGDDYEPSDAAKARLAKRAEVLNEEFTVDGVDES
jgi:hypothetical protein